MEAFAHVAARHLEKVVLLEFLENAPLQLHKLKTGTRTCSQPDVTQILHEMEFSLNIFSDSEPEKFI